MLSVPSQTTRNLWQSSALVTEFRIFEPARLVSYGVNFSVLHSQGWTTPSTFLFDKFFLVPSPHFRAFSNNIPHFRAFSNNMGRDYPHFSEVRDSYLVYFTEFRSLIFNHYNRISEN
jgi:hypothetical protein